MFLTVSVKQHQTDGTGLYKEQVIVAQSVQTDYECGDGNEILHSVAVTPFNGGTIFFRLKEGTRITVKNPQGLQIADYAIFKGIK